MVDCKYSNTCINRYIPLQDRTAFCGTQKWKTGQRKLVAINCRLERSRSSYDRSFQHTFSDRSRYVSRANSDIRGSLGMIDFITIGKSCLGGLFGVSIVGIPRPLTSIAPGSRNVWMCLTSYQALATYAKAQNLMKVATLTWIRGNTKYLGGCSLEMSGGTCNLDGGNSPVDCELSELSWPRPLSPKADMSLGFVSWAQATLAFPAGKCGSGNLWCLPPGGPCCGLSFFRCHTRTKSQTSCHF